MWGQPLGCLAMAKPSGPAMIARGRALEIEALHLMMLLPS
jgi:hypothetical protein